MIQRTTLDDEVTACADFIVHYLTRHPGLAPGQVLVLSPRRFVGNRIRDALIERKLNSLSYFLEDELQPPSAAEGFCLLTLLLDPVDRTALRAWVGMGHPNDHASAYQRLRQVSQELHLELSDTINEVSQGTFKVKYTNGIIERWHELQRRLASLCGLQGLELTRALWPPENEDCADLRLKADNIANEFPEPKQLFEALRQEITQPQLPDSKSDIIRVMSLHKSKGLTAALIVVAGCVAGALPTIHTSEPSAVQDFELDEQRRLFYVAITRANETVVISSCIMLPSRDALQNGIQVIGRYRIGGEDWVKTAASPFIADLGVAAPLPVDTATWRAQAGF